MPAEQGNIWLGLAPHKSGPSYRPWGYVQELCWSKHLFLLFCTSYRQKVDYT